MIIPKMERVHFCDQAYDRNPNRKQKVKLSLRGNLEPIMRSGASGQHFTLLASIIVLGTHPMTHFARGCPRDHETIYTCIVQVQYISEEMADISTAGYASTLINSGSTLVSRFHFPFAIFRFVLFCCHLTINYRCHISFSHALLNISL